MLHLGSVPERTRGWGTAGHLVRVKARNGGSCLHHGWCPVEVMLREYVEHDNRKRPQRALALDSPDKRSPPRIPESGRVVSRPGLGGLHHEYEWAA